MSTKMNLILGTAMWGWTTPPATAFALLDQFYAAGGRDVDGATNYPINKQPADFRRAEQILFEWIQAHGVADLRVMMKVGSLNNLYTPDHNLSKSFLLIMLDEYQHALGTNLDTFMLHWDNRSEAEAIRDTYEALQIAQEQGCRLGLSGIRHPELHAQVNADFGFDFRIQVKHNLLQSDYSRYAPFHGAPRFIAYGINAGGIKLDPAKYTADSSLQARGGDTQAPHPMAAPLQAVLQNAAQVPGRPAPRSMNHCGLAYAYHSPGMGGILIGPSKAEQLQDSLNFHQALLSYDYSDFYQQLKTLAANA